MKARRHAWLTLTLLVVVIATVIRAQDTQPTETPEPSPTLTETALPTDLPPTETASATATAEPSQTETPTETATATTESTVTSESTITETASPTITLTPSATAETPIEAQNLVEANTLNCSSGDTVIRASINTGGEGGNADSGSSGLALSASGRYIAFGSAASNLIANDTNGVADIFVFDRNTCQTVRISSAIDGSEANNASSNPVMTPDGQTIVFASLATNLIPGEANAGIFVRNLLNNTFIRVPGSSAVSGHPSISADGRYVTYRDTVNASTINIMLYDTVNGQNSLIETVSNAASVSKIAANGSVVVYLNASAALSIYDRASQQVSTTSFSVNAAGLFAVSADGNTLAFASDAANLVGDDTNNLMDVFVFDRSTGQITRVSVSATGEEANNVSAFPSISADGSFVSFVSSASNLVEGDNNNGLDVFVRDVNGQSTYRLSTGWDGSEANNGVSGFAAPISDDNQFVAFASTANNLVMGDSGSTADVFVAQLTVSAPMMMMFNASAATFTPLPTLTWGAPLSVYACDPARDLSPASVDSNGTQGLYASDAPAISSTGRYIVFDSVADNLVTGDTNGVSDVFIYDRENCQTERVSVDASGVEGNGASELPYVSPNGRYVTFISSASNLIASDTNNQPDLFLKDRQTGTVTRILANTPYGGFIGDDNQSIAYRSGNSIRLYNLSTLVDTQILSLTNLSVGRRFVSNDIRYFVFSSTDNNLVAGDTNGTADVFLYDRQTSQMARISISPTGAVPNGASFDASISGSCRYMVFTSSASNLVTGDTNGVPDIFFRDLITGALSRVSVSSSGVQGNQASGSASISDCGRYVAFSSLATNLVTSDTNGTVDVFAHDRTTGQTYVISRGTSGTPGNNTSDGPLISRNGDYITFWSIATNLLSGDANFVSDVFVARRAAFAPATPVTPTPTNTPIPTATPDPALNPLGVGVYQENHPRLYYTGNWVNFSGVGPAGGAFRYSNDPNGRMAFWINDTVGLVTIYRTMYVMYGTTEIYVDDGPTPVAVMNSYSATLLYNQPFSFNIAPGAHKIELRNVGTSYSNVDQIELLAPTVPLTTTPGTYQESEPNITYSGNWTTSANSSMLGGAHRYTNDPNARLSFKIDNTVARVIIYRTVFNASVYGSWQVYVDGVLTATIPNNTSASFLLGVPYMINVTPGRHQIELRNTSNKFSDIDQIVLLGEAPTIGTGTYQESDTALTYEGDWTPNSNSFVLGGSHRYTNDPNARVRFNINNTVARVVIYRSIYTASVGGSWQVYVDGVLNTTIPNNTAASNQYGVPFTINVTPGNHTIELRNTTNRYSDLDQIVLLGPPQPLGVGTYQESEATLSYTGSWSPNSNSFVLGGGHRYTNDPNATVSFQINNTVSRVVIYRSIYTPSVGGSLQVYVDGVLTATILNNTASSYLYGVPFTINVTPGNHTIELRNTTNKYSDLDQIALLGPAQALTTTPGTYQDTDPALTYTGNWVSSANSGTLGGTHSYTNDPNARVSFSINNTVARVVIFRTIYNSALYGSWDVYVDGVLTTSIPNNTSSSFQFGVPFTINVTPGNHTIELRNTGSLFSDIDQIVLLGPVQPLGTGTYQESEPSLTYTGNWVSSVNSGMLGGAHRYTNDPNARVSFEINNTVARVVIHRTIFNSSVYGSWDVYVDGVLTATIANNTSSSFQLGVPFTINVTPGNHTIELRNTSNKFSDLDQIVLLGPVQALGTGTYQESNAGLTYVGNWVNSANSGMLGGAHSYTNDPNARVSFNIDSSVARVVIHRTIYNSSLYGSWNLYLDGVLVSNIPNNTSSTFQLGVPFTFNVTPGNHTIELRNTTNKFSDIDQIVLLGPVQALGTGTYQETDPGLTYVGNWTPNSSSLVLGGAHRFTNDPNARVSFPINNTVGRVVIYRTIFTSGVGGSWQVYVNGVLATTIPNNTAVGSYQYGVPFTINVTPGNNTIELRNTNNLYSDLDQIGLLPPA